MSTALLVSATEVGKSALQWALLLAQKRTSELEVIFLVKRLSSSLNGSAQELTSETSAEELPEYLRELQKELATLSFADQVSITIRELETESIEEKLLPLLDKLSTRLLVVAQNIDGKTPLSSALEYALEEYDFDLLSLRAPRENTSSALKILVPLAGGSHSVRALEIADSLQAEVTALHVQTAHDSLAEELGKETLGGLIKHSSVKEPEQIHRRVIHSDSVEDAIRAETKQEYSLVLVGASQYGAIRKFLFGDLSQKLLYQHSAPALGVVRATRPLQERVIRRFERWLDLRVPQLTREERVRLSLQLQEGSSWSFDFMALLSLATAIACLGLLQNSTAVVIGAMLVAPLMVPLLGAGLALMQSNMPLLRSSLFSVGMGTLSSVVIGIIFGLITPHNETAELAARGGPNLLDLGVGFLSGIAASYCLARPNLSAALAGVAIAAALVPPLSTIGIALAWREMELARGACLLYSSNVFAIILGATITLYACGIRSSDTIGGAVLARRGWLVVLTITVCLALPLGPWVLFSTASDAALGGVKERQIRYVVERALLSRGHGQLINSTTDERPDGNILTVEFETKSIPREILAGEILQTVKRLDPTIHAVVLTPTVVLRATSPTVPQQ